MTSVRGRLAPSPTGRLHLGNAWAFLLAWLACRKAGGTLVLRMEDIDPDRATQDWAEEIVFDLHWLGLDWDEGPHPDGTPGETGDCGPYVQSRRGTLYEQALHRLGARVYPCYCTRKELRDQLHAMAGAPHVDDRGAPYPGTCRHLTAEERAQREAGGRHPCLRLNTEGLADIVFMDALCGPQRFSLAGCGGDFALRRSDGVWAYQLAVVVDDALMGVNQVVRGEDILVSTPRQLALFDLLGWPRPAYAHIPLLCDAAGERLAKRHNSLSLRALRAAGRTPQELVGLLAFKAGLQDRPDPKTPRELLDGFTWQRLPRGPVLLDAQ